MAEMGRAIVMSPEDNTAVALADLAAGEDVSLKIAGRTVTTRLLDAVGFGHKFALKDIAAGEKVFKYGTVIGLASSAIASGQHVHIHNVESIRARGDKKK
ncbi:MAG: UxaA family hydrolase [Hyphomicrobiales bacterium]